MKKYHINLNTGVPSVCNATSGQCPYGSSKEHFNSFEEAEIFSSQVLETKFPMFGIEENDPDSIEDWAEAWGYQRDILESYPDEEIGLSYYTRLSEEHEYGYFYDMKPEEILDIIENTDDEKLIGLILKSELLTTDPNFNSYLEAAIKSTAFPNSIKAELAKDSSNFTSRFVRLAVANQSFTQRQLFQMAESSNDYRVKETIMSSKKFKKETIDLVVGEDGLRPVKEWYLYVGYNSNIIKGSEQDKNVTKRMWAAQRASKDGVLRE